MVILAVVVEDREVVSIGLAGFGAVLMPLAALLPRLVGSLRVSAQGFEAELTAAVTAEAEARGLPPEAVELAVTKIRSEAQLAFRDWAAQRLDHASAAEPVEIPFDDYLQARLDPLVKELLAGADEATEKDQA